jgi:hypothetical protein
MGDGGAPPIAVTVTAGNNFFRSNRNGSRNAAVDTVAAGGKVTWMWSGTVQCHTTCNRSVCQAS